MQRCGESPVKNRQARRLLLVCALLCALSLVFGKAARDTADLRSRPAYRYADGSGPMLTNFDGYFFLRLTQDLLTGDYTREDPLRAYPRPVPAPLLCRLTSWLHLFSGGSLQNAAFFLPPLLSCGLLAAVLLWARLLGREWCAAVAVCAAALAPYWLEVTAVGRFDKDCLNPVFVLLAAWCLARNHLSAGRARWAYLLGAFGVLLLFNWWWPKAAAPISLAYVLLWAVCGHKQAPKPERLLKLALPAGAAGFLFFVLIQGQTGTSGLWGRFAQALDLLPMIFKTGSMAHVSGAIDELTGLTPSGLALACSGSWWAFAAGLAGLAWVVRERRGTVIYLLPLLVFGLFSLHAQRFLLLFFPLIALGAGCFVERTADLLARNVHSALRRMLYVLLAALLLAPCLVSAWRQLPKPYIRQGSDRLALVLREKAPKHAVIWNWWDYGYFLQYRTRRFTLLDGGMQTQRNCMLAAVPLASDDPVMAANWIRFFAAYGVERFAAVSNDKGGDQNAVAWLKRVFGGMIAAPEEYFPEVETYLFLPVRFLRLSKYWLDFGTLYTANRPDLRVHLELFPAEGFIFGDAGVRLSQDCRARGYTQFPTVLEAGTDRLDGVALHTRPDPYLIHTPSSPWVYAADFPVTQTLAFQLAVPTGFQHPCFEPVSYDPAVGGVWRVRACLPD